MNKLLQELKVKTESIKKTLMVEIMEIKSWHMNMDFIGMLPTEFKRWKRKSQALKTRKKKCILQSKNVIKNSRYKELRKSGTLSKEPV